MMELNKITMKIDTEPSRSTVAEDTLDNMWLEELYPAITSKNIRLKLYTGKLIPVLDIATVTVSH